MDIISEIVGPGVDAPRADVAPDPMDIALEWIGFPEATRHQLRLEGFSAFGDLKLMKDKDIRNLVDSSGRLSIGNGRFIFGLHRIHYSIGLVHWVQDFQRVCGVPSLDEFDGDPDTFKAALDVAFNRANVRRIKQEQADTLFAVDAEYRRRETGTCRETYW